MHTIKFVRFALKNLLRRRTRTALTILGVAAAVAIFFSLLTFNAGYTRQLNKELDRVGAHLLAVPKGCPYEAAALIIHGGVIPQYLMIEDLALAQAIPGVEVAAPLLLHQFFKDNRPHIVYGIDAVQMQDLKPWWSMRDGRFFTNDEKGVMVVGNSLAKSENLKVGDVLSFGLRQEPFEIVGILDETQSQDDEFHFLSISEVQRIFDKPDQMTAIAIKLTDVSRISEISARLQEIPDIQVVTMSQMMGTVLNLVGSVRSLLISVILVAVIISIFGIINTLLMSVNERRSEFGMMKAIGASGGDIGRLILIETVFLTLSGGILGIGFSILGSTLIEGFVRDIVPYTPAGNLITVDGGIIGISLAFSLIIGIVCGLYPAIKSSRLSPMEAIRNSYE
ncbi:MAG TPA: ABC transporter permease [Dehalococcoidales bacterium]|nr:ABC transporter permease [Dehalococcoidales bacterium]